MKKLFGYIKAYKKELFRVSDIHKIYLEESGNPKGKPIVHLHGGPGRASKPLYRRYYNPKKYRIILYDQRGCGKSKPPGEIRQNTTGDLVNDIEKIRKHLRIDKWVVSGGSWGSTLALAYAQKHPGNIKALLLRGIFTARQSERNWLTKAGSSFFFPDKWEKYSNFIPAKERNNLTKAYAKRILGKDKKLAMKAAKIANSWESGLTKLRFKEKKVSKKISEKDLIASRIFYHYEINKGFLRENQLLANVNKMKNIPGVIIQGRYDMICPPITAWELHKAWPKSTLELVTLAGHLSSEKGTTDKIVEYSERFASL